MQEDNSDQNKRLELIIVRIEKAEPSDSAFLSRMEAVSGIEPEKAVLQTAALDTRPRRQFCSFDSE